MSMAGVRVTMEVGIDGVAIITICNPPVNSLAIPIISGLKEKFEEAMRRDDVKAIVLTGNAGKFSGGFDINVFQNVHKTGDISILPDVSIDLVVNTIEDAKKPAVAAIEGLALGGGLELTMVCGFCRGQDFPYFSISLSVHTSTVRLVHGNLFPPMLSNGLCRSGSLHPQP